VHLASDGAERRPAAVRRAHGRRHARHEHRPPGTGHVHADDAGDGSRARSHGRRRGAHRV
jgi:hypothetical protein